MSVHTSPLRERQTLATILLCVLSLASLSIIATAPKALAQESTFEWSAELENLARWRMGRTVYLLGSTGADGSRLRESLRSKGIGASYLGGSLAYVYERLPRYRTNIHRTDSLVLLNIALENTERLREWPEEDRTLLPADLGQLALYEPPFALLAERDGRIRGVVVGRSSDEIWTLVLAMTEHDVPVGVPWSARIVLNITSASSASESWYRQREVIGRELSRVSYLPPHEEDARIMLDWAEFSLGELQMYFPDAFDVVDQPITLWIHGEGELEPGRAFAEVNPPTLHFTAPSISALQSSYFDRTYYVGNIAHEFAHVYFRTIRRLAGGYNADPNADDAPRWFHEGLGEYFRLLVIGEETFERKYARYGDVVSRLLYSPLESVEDVYAAGAWALRFLDARFGLEGIRKILTSSEPTFWGAVREATGLSRTEFDQSFWEWLQHGVDAGT